MVYLLKMVISGDVPNKTNGGANKLGMAIKCVFPSGRPENNCHMHSQCTSMSRIAGALECVGGGTWGLTWADSCGNS